MTARYLIDTSAVVRAERDEPVREVLAPKVTNREVAICTPGLLEVMFGTQATKYERALQNYRLSMHVLPITPEACDRAVEVQRMLARTSQHRTAKAVDLLTAACAEVNGLTMLHYDRDFDAIAKVTGQPAQWVVPSGSVS